MKLAILLLAFIALSAFAAESKHDKDVRECRKAPPTMKHPADLKKRLRTVRRVFDGDD